MMPDSRKGKTLVPGHSLRYEGRAHVSPDCPDCFGPEGLAFGNPRSGHASCRCGAYSPHLNNTAARKRWHAEHKEAAR